MSEQNTNNWDAESVLGAAKTSEKESNPATQQLGIQLIDLLGQSSLLGSQRIVPEVEETAKLIKERVQSLKDGTPGEKQKKILPEVNIITKPINSSLPGLILSLAIGPVVYIMPVLFSNRNLTNTLEEIQLDQGNSQRKMSMPFAPVTYGRPELINEIKNHYKQSMQARGVNDCVIINMRIIDLEQYNTEEVQNVGKSQMLRDEIMRNWEQGLMVQIATIGANTDNVKLPSPFNTPGNRPYGQHNSAIARVEPVRGQYVHEGQLSPANLSVRLQTATGNGYTGNADQSREIVTAYATVGLMGVPLSQFRPDQGAMGMPYMPTMNGRPQGYAPLQPLVIMNHSKPGEAMGDATGLSTYFMGLYGVMATNNNYLFTEGVRSRQVGSRGSLVDMEYRIKQMELGLTRDKNTEMKEAKLADVDFTANWLRNNVGPKAVFASDLIEFGSEAAIANFLMNLTPGAKDYAKRSRTVVAIIDTMTDKNFSAIIKNNMETKTGWVPGKPILHMTNQLIPVGSALVQNKRISLGEVDEMFLSHLYQDQQGPMNQYLENMYGSNPNQPEKVRRYNLWVSLNQIFSEGVNLFGFGRRCYWDPGFMAAFGQAMDSIGNLQVSGSMGQFTANVAVYAPGTGYVVTAGAGQAGGVIMNSGQVLGAGGNVVFGQ